MDIDFSTARWLNSPKRFDITPKAVTLTTDPGSDFWQRSYYGFRNDNAHALLLDHPDNFTFTVQVSFQYQGKYDQCGLVIYIDSDNWFKASAEYETPELSRLGSVVTNLGYSDWATTDIPTPTTMWYRLSRRGPDFLIEASPDGDDFRQMRIFHLHCLGETTAEMGKLDPPQPPRQPVPFGLYACSPTQASFTARFEHWKLEPCTWHAHT
jgi:regulation of enolase protein 1 (concanavalin A-like superfamily)